MRKRKLATETSSVALRAQQQQKLSAASVAQSSLFLERLVWDIKTDWISPRLRSTPAIDVNYISDNGQTAAHIVAGDGSFGRIEGYESIWNTLALRGFYGWNVVDASGRTALYLAAHLGRLHSANMLLALGADPTVGATAKSPLCAAIDSCSKEHAEGSQFIAALLVAGADPNRWRNATQSPLSLALFVGNMEGAEMLLLSGALADGTFSIGKSTLVGNYTPLQHAVFSDATLPEWLFLLFLKRGADFNRPSSNRGKTLLHFMAAKGHAASIRTLVSVNPDLDLWSTDVDGEYAMNCADANCAGLVAELFHHDYGRRSPLIRDSLSFFSTDICRVVETFLFAGSFIQ